jgi:hypothetical protein
VTVTYDDTMNPATSPVITMDTGGNWGVQTPVGWSGGNTIYTATFTHDGTQEYIAAETATIAPGSGATDAAGNPENGDTSPSFVVDTQKPTITGIAISDALITEADIGAGNFTIDIDYDENMAGASTPTVVFTPDIVASGTLTLNAGLSGWTDADTYQAVYDVADGDEETTLTNINITNATDTAGNVQNAYNNGAPGVEVDNEEPDITDNGTLTITTDNGPVGVAALNDGATNQDKVTQSAVTISNPDGDTTTIDLTALTGEAALAAGVESGVVIAGAVDNAARTFTITVTDDAGNTNTIVSDAISVDNEPPVIDVVGIVAMGATDANAPLVADIGDTVAYTDAQDTSTADAGTVNWTVDLLAPNNLTGNAAATSAAEETVIATGNLNGAYTFTETGTDDAGNTVTGQTAPALTCYTITAPALNSTFVSPSSNTVSATDAAVVNFITTSALPINGKIDIVFPAGFIVGAANTVTNTSNIDGTFTVTTNGLTITVTRNGDGNPGNNPIIGGTPIQFRISPITTPSIAGTTGTFIIRTRTNAGSIIDEDTAVAGVTIIDPNAQQQPASGGGGGGGYRSTLTAPVSAIAPGTGQEVSTTGKEEGLAPSALEVAAKFMDTANHWAKSYIDQLADLGIVQGKSAIRFAPNDNITRAELLKIALNAFGYEVPVAVSEKPSGDVKISDWFAPYVQVARENKIIYGLTDAFNPNAPATRAFAITVLIKATAFTDVVQHFHANYTSHADWSYAGFPDVPMMEWFAPYVAYAKDLGVIIGYTDGTFGPSRSITRAEIAKIVVKLLELI